MEKEKPEKEKPPTEKQPEKEKPAEPKAKQPEKKAPNPVVSPVPNPVVNPVTVANPKSNKTSQEIPKVTNLPTTTKLITINKSTNYKQMLQTNTQPLTSNQ